MSYDYGKSHRSTILHADTKDSVKRNDRLGLKTEPVRRLRRNKWLLFVLSMFVGWFASLLIFYSMGYFDKIKPLIGN